MNNPFKGNVQKAGQQQSTGHDSTLSALYQFMRHSIRLVAALLLGFTGTLACFAFTYWLSRQSFQCPPWAIDCHVSPAVVFFASRLGFVQGFVGSVYGVCLAGMVYGSYQFAETLLWPLMARQSFTLNDIDTYLAHARGSLAAFIPAIWRARGWSHTTPVIIVALMAILLQVDSILVGYAFTVRPVATHCQSSHVYGGGIDYAFSQQNPPIQGPSPLQVASNLYSSWSTKQSIEMLPNLRDFIIDRSSLMDIGQFTVGALEMRKSISCYPEQLSIDYARSDLAAYFAVNSHFTGDWSQFALSDNNSEYVWLPYSPGHLSVYMDSYQTMSETRAITKLVFTTLNGSIEHGLLNPVRDYCGIWGNYSCAGVSALACDIDMDLVPSTACNGPCSPLAPNATPLSSDRTVVAKANHTGLLRPISVILAASATQFGPFTWGAQPTFIMGNLGENSSDPNVLPAAFSSFPPLPALPEVYHYTQAGLAHFIDVAAGAMAIAIAQFGPLGVTRVKSTQPTLRLETRRSFLLLVPPAIAWASLLVLAAFSALLHRRAGLLEVREGGLKEIVLSAAPGDLHDRVNEIRQADVTDPIQALEKIKLRYGWIDKEGEVAGLGSEDRITPFHSVH